MIKAKRFPILILAVVAIVSTAIAEPRPAIGLKVRRTKVKNVSADYYATSEHKQMLNVELRNMRSTPATVLVQWLFLAKPARGKGEKFVYDYDGDTITLKGKELRKIEARSKKIESESWEYLGKFGATPSDWVVVVMTTGNNAKVLKVDASSTPLERKCSTFDGFMEILDTHKED